MIDQIIGPVGRQAFLANYFEKKPLIQKSASKLHSLFSIRDFDRYLIAGEGSLHNFVRISKNGATINIPTYNGQAITQREFILEQFKTGATLKLEELDARHPKISILCKQLEQIFGGYAFAKPFLTGANFKGLPAHFDTTEVFVVQLEGRKSWKVWEKLVENPTLPMQRSLVEDELLAPEIEVVLEKGDILYIPAGTPHVAKCLDDYSLHMAFGLQPIKIFEVLEGFIRLMSEHVGDLRKNVFPFSEQTTLEKLTKDLLKRMAGVPFEEILSDFEIAYNATKHEISDERLASLVHAHNINSQTHLQVRLGANLRIRENEDGEHISVYFSSTIHPGKPLVSTPSSLSLPAFCRDEVESICAKNYEVFTPVSLAGKLNDESKVTLCRELVNFGIIFLV
ncbi:MULTISPECIES: JmjC domain-containing protein [unclassified Bartonella]|uniref:JmjC domain-containing protein n=1 Tax=unclassified Bartonella TaxID=2645622 RepID=UPI0035CEB867